jgi:hypothetical protein
MQDNRPVVQVGDAALSRTSGYSSTRQSSRYLALNIIIASLIAGLLAGATVALALKLWMMFVGWISFGTGRDDLGRGSTAIVALLIGLILGIGGIAAVVALQSTLGVLALPLVVVVSAILALSSQMTPINSVPSYFLGMTAFFASNLEPGVPAFLSLASAAFIGAIGGTLVILCGRWVSRLA